MLTIQNIEKFKRMRCKGMYVTDISTYAMEGEHFYAFTYSVSDFSELEVRNKFDNMGIKTITVCLDRTPNPRDWYGLWVIGFLNETEISIGKPDLEKAHRLASKVTHVLNKLIAIC